MDIWALGGVLLQLATGVCPYQKISDEANRQGVETLNAFFDFEVSEHIKKNYPKASIISANNVFAHCDDLIGIIRGVKNILSQNGVFVFEVSYLVDVLEKTLFDTIYHEHLSYHSVIPLCKFFKSNGMHLFKVDRINKDKVVTVNVPVTPKSPQTGGSSGTTTVKQDNSDSVNSNELLLTSIEK